MRHKEFEMTLEQSLVELISSNVTLLGRVDAMQLKIDALEVQNKNYRSDIHGMEFRMEQLKQDNSELIAEIRRLRRQMPVQELVITEEVDW